MNSLISVVMSVYNEDPRYLYTAIQSILAQTYKNFEFIIINDGSDEETTKALVSASQKDERIILLQNEERLGITKSLIKGFAIAKGDYIARMDSDDFSVPERFERQIAFLQDNTNIDIVGTGVVSFGDKNIFMSPCGAINDDEVKSELFFTSALCHPSVMIKKSFLDKTKITYDSTVKKGQDYDLWERASDCGKLAVMENVLLYYRIHDKQITSQFESEQITTAEMVMKRRLSKIGITPTEDEYKAHLKLKGLISDADLNSVELWAKKLIEANNRVNLVDKKTFETNVAARVALVRFKNKIFKPCDAKFFISKLRLIVVSKLKLRKANRIFNKIYQ